MSASPAGAIAEPRGYFIVHSNTAHAEHVEQHRAALTKLREVHEGRCLVRAQPTESLGGPRMGFRLTLVEHRTLTQLRRLLASPEYETLNRQIGFVGAGPSWSSSSR